MNPNQSVEPIRLEGTYTKADIRAYSAFLAGRVAGSKLWALGIFVLMPLLWSKDIVRSWPIMASTAIVLVGFLLLLRFRIIPNRLYRSAAGLPEVFERRRIIVEATEVKNYSNVGGHAFLLENVREVITTPEHLFVMVAHKQGIIIPRSWIGEENQVSHIAERLLSKAIPAR